MPRVHRLTLANKTVQSDNDETPPVWVSESRGSAAGCPPELCPEVAKPSYFSAPDEKIEVATQDEAFKVLLSVQDGNLALLDARTIHRGARSYEAPRALGFRSVEVPCRSVRNGSTATGNRSSPSCAFRRSRAFAASAIGKTMRAGGREALPD